MVKGGAQQMTKLAEELETTRFMEELETTKSGRRRRR